MTTPKTIQWDSSRTPELIQALLKLFLENRYDCYTIKNEILDDPKTGERNFVDVKVKTEISEKRIEEFITSLSGNDKTRIGKKSFIVPDYIFMYHLKKFFDFHGNITIENIRDLSRGFRTVQTRKGSKIVNYFCERCWDIGYEKGNENALDDSKKKGIPTVVGNNSYCPECTTELVAEGAEASAKLAAIMYAMTDYWPAVPHTSSLLEDATERGVLPEVRAIIKSFAIFLKDRKEYASTLDEIITDLQDAATGRIGKS